MNYTTVIGLEIHVQLKTKSKMFCGCDNNAEEAAPNTLVCPVCLGLPGVLPVANKQAIEWTLLTGLALNSEISDISKFDRKHYFYPDLPKNYQISQFDMPFATGGWLEIRNPKAESRKINLIRIHLEEDAGKLIHTNDASLVDLNRAGTPLMEIVTRPEISSPTEAKIFLQELRSIFRFLSVSDANMEKGHLRCDANISISINDNSHPELDSGSSPKEIPGQARNDKDTLGTPVEIKNINSFRMLERALIYEEKRQKEVLEAGGKITKETRGWNDQKGETYSQRSKEFTQDYRYFPEPDLPPFNVKKAFNIEKLKAMLPELPAQKRNRYVSDWKLRLQDAEILAEDKQMAEYFEKVSEKVSPRLAANWVINELKMNRILTLAPENLTEMLQKLESGVISGKIAKEILSEMIETGKKPSEIIESKDLKQVDDEKELEKIVDKIIANNPKPVDDIKAGKKEAIGYLIGQIMKESRGQANPDMVNKILLEKIK